MAGGREGEVAAGVASIIPGPRLYFPVWKWKYWMPPIQYSLKKHIQRLWNYGICKEQKDCGLFPRCECSTTYIEAVDTIRTFYIHSITCTSALQPSLYLIL
jgi:hypothetical protein